MNTPSVQEVRYHDRHQAALSLARELEPYAARKPLVVAVARGGLVVAAPVAQRLGAELDVIVVQKIGVPGHPHITAGALSSRGASHINHRALGAFGISPVAIDRAIDKERLIVEQQERQIRGGRPPSVVTGRLVLIVDDAVITGSTLHTAIRVFREAGAGEVVVAVPVGAQSALANLRKEVKELVCPAPVERLDALADAYESDDAVTVAYARELFEQARRQTSE